jgi:hypothetical protein
MTIHFSETSVALRQYSSTKLTGVAPVGAAVDPADPDVAYTPALYAKGIHTYCNADDKTLVDLTDGGIFDMGTDVFYAITSIHAKLDALGTFTLDLVDRVSSEATRIYTTEPGVHAYISCSPTIFVIPNNYIKVVTTVPGTIDIYCSRVNWHR